MIIIIKVIIIVTAEWAVPSRVGCTTKILTAESAKASGKIRNYFMFYHRVGGLVPSKKADSAILSGKNQLASFTSRLVFNP